MPGDYGPAGKWIHDRAHGIMEDGDTPKDVAYAIATQQAHKVGKSPKDFRTPHGVHEAKMKYDEPKAAYQKTAGLEKQKNMAELTVEAIRSGMDRAKALKLLAKGKLDVLRQSAPKATALQAFESTLGKTSSVARLEGFFDELEKIAGPAFEAALQAGGGKMTDAAHAAGHSEWLKQQAAKANLGTIVKRYGRAGGSAAKPVAGGLLSGVKRLFGRN